MELPTLTVRFRGVDVALLTVPAKLIALLVVKNSLLAANVTALLYVCAPVVVTPAPVKLVVPPAEVVKEASADVPPTLPTFNTPLVVVRVRPKAVPVASTEAKVRSPLAVVIVRLAPETCRSLVTVIPAESLPVRLADKIVLPVVVRMAGATNEALPVILILPLCDPPPIVTTLNVLPINASSEARISNVLAPASAVPPRLITFVAVVGLSVNVPVPATAALKLISSAINDRLPIPLNADVTEIKPVPALRDKVLPAPAIVLELARVMVELLAVVLMVKLAPKTTAVLASPSVTAPFPAVVLLVTILPDKFKVAGRLGLNAPPEYVKVSVASSPKVSVPLVSNGVAV